MAVNTKLINQIKTTQIYYKVMTRLEEIRKKIVDFSPENEVDYQLSQLRSKIDEVNTPERELLKTVPKVTPLKQIPIHYPTRKEYKYHPFNSFTKFAFWFFIWGMLLAVLSTVLGIFVDFESPESEYHWYDRFITKKEFWWIIIGLAAFLIIWAIWRALSNKAYKAAISDPNFLKSVSQKEKINSDNKEKYENELYNAKWAKSENKRIEKDNKESELLVKKHQPEIRKLYDDFSKLENQKAVFVQELASEKEHNLEIMDQAMKDVRKEYPPLPEITSWRRYDDKFYADLIDVVASGQVTDVGEGIRVVEDRYNEDKNTQLVINQIKESTIALQKTIAAAANIVGNKIDRATIVLSAKISKVNYSISKTNKVISQANADMQKCLNGIATQISTSTIANTMNRNLDGVRNSLNNLYNVNCDIRDYVNN